MSPLTLFHSPGSCSRVVIVALEHTGAEFDLRRVDLASGDQRQPAYLALNPKGKVPLLQTPQGLLSEVVAIVGWLDGQFPGAGLLPPPGSPWQRAQTLSWLAWSVSTLHPTLFRARMPARISAEAAAHAGIKSAALAELTVQLATVEEALADGRPWLGGADWSMADTHVCWAFGRSLETGLDATALPRLAELAGRHAQRPAFGRALARESAGPVAPAHEPFSARPTAP